MREQRSPRVRQTRSNASGVDRITAFVVADQKRVERVRSRHVSSDHELLSAIRTPFEPVARAARTVRTARPFRHDAFESILPDRSHERRCCDGERLGVSDAFRQTVHDSAQALASLLQGGESQVPSPHHQEVEGIEHDLRPGRVRAPWVRIPPSPPAGYRTPHLLGAI
jgi:hypothetical protein